MQKALMHKAQGFWHTQRVKRLVREQLGGGVQCLVSVREMVCTDPGCEGLATEIRIVTLDSREIRALIHKQASDIRLNDILTIF